ncbi:class II aldolase/adducin family protein [Ferrimonas marina]|uniref:Rhamnose utilisation protein RhaD, predicted bifunctional aldolase and dehydrogenase n=1 Tax=Ferrimonas marina TaxID=299255 RepID=A0A1M5X746_9GAMM|nr:class II aldolase/adducin family protein [Ferrimonas marina]SHH95657.1 Rhamnose utilisation protein RhaD, predicted bifunctional aldolase and dehydrogenase [Ferrimonas marina]
MESRWNEAEAGQHDSLLAQRVYSSRLLGAEPMLVLQGGGNTSVKERLADEFGQPCDILSVKGSGWDLATIEAAGFARVKMDTLMALAQLEQLTDAQMVAKQKAAMLDPNAPSPSIEAILHAVIPFAFVDHSHADAVVTLTNTPDGERWITEALGPQILVVPYVMPGFDLARTVYRMTRDVDWQQLQGIVLMNHGLFTFGDDARSSYEQHIALVSKAETYLSQHGTPLPENGEPSEPDLLALCRLRREVSEACGLAVIARFDGSALARQCAALQPDTIPNYGPLTPEHVIRTKRLPLRVPNDEAQLPKALADFQQAYRDYFDRHADGQTLLNTAPNYALCPDVGAVAFAPSESAAAVVADIVEHTLAAIWQAQGLGGYQALPDDALFAIEYWQLEQAKLAKAGAPPPLQGRVVALAESDLGIRELLQAELKEQGATVVLAQSLASNSELRALVHRLGGIDDLVVNRLAQGADVLLDRLVPVLQQGVAPRFIALDDLAGLPQIDGLRFAHVPREGSPEELAEDVLTLLLSNPYPSDKEA